VIFVGVEQGIVIAIVLSLLDHVRRSYSAPNFVLVRDEQGDWRYREPAPGTVSEPGLVVYRLGNELYYANVARFQEEVLGLVNGADPSLKWLVIDAGAVNDVDYSAGQALGGLDALLQAKGITLALVELNPNAREQIGRYGSLKGEPQDRYFDTLGEAVRAFRRATSTKETRDG
jgi:MFS superfamily sulfate permease-like transporter